MARTHATNITSMPQSIEDERRSRMVKYLILMGIRAACLIALIWVRGPWMLVVGAGAIFLPYFAVVLANAVTPRRRPKVDRPNVITPLHAPRESDRDESERQAS
ncbi:DUF3099 domain-containing protein [Pseudoclavibacter endophyticus]|uniref:DUF3099 domain-containing protein n=1 Tax=Pseudoclavibacter endophyticus TaxID=1778590 RepID=UPI00166768A8|nr:DUF3099 domain-containing protein [Pseudoclavibacter endophyticus]